MLRIKLNRSIMATIKIIEMELPTAPYPLKNKITT